jgi:DNA replication protein DnaC
MKKWELYKKGEIKLPKEEIENYKYATYKHKRNEETANTFITIIKLPYYIFWKFPVWTLKKVTFKDTREKQQKEIKRLKLVIKSKERAREKMELENVLPWSNEYLVKDGVFKIGRDVKTGKIITIDFNVNANLLVGGMPGTGKTKLIQLMIFQCLKYGCKCYIADFKGGVDTIRFANKSNVITEHTELLDVLIKFKKEIKRRQKLFISVGAENLKEYNKITGKNLKREYLIIDELGEAMEIFEVDGLNETEVKQLKKDIENNLKSIARLGRAFGLNLICGTQRPDVGILEGQTRDQFGGRVCFKAIANTSNIVLSSKIAFELPDVKGRAIVMQGTNYVETQVFFWDKETLKEIDNKKLDKKDLKIVASDKKRNKNTDTYTGNNKEVETVDIDLD